MDNPDISGAELCRALAEIRWVNRRLGGTSAILKEIKKLKPENRTLSILDLGAGSADIPRAIVDWGRTHHINVQATALDLSPIVLEEAKKLYANYPEIRCIQGDALNLPYEDESFDLAISSMFMHHLGEDEAPVLLRNMARVSKIGLVVNDLERHPFAWLGIRLLGQLTGKSAMFMNDAPLSVLKGFSYQDMKRLCEKAPLSSYAIQRRAPFRWLLTSWKNPVEKTSHEG